jgi:hypothetical protein
MAIRAGLCTPARQEQCRKDNGGWLDAICKDCKSKRPEDLHPYTHKLLRIKALQDGGYPLDQDDLTLEEWMDLGRIKYELEHRENNPASR